MLYRQLTIDGDLIENQEVRLDISTGSRGEEGSTEEKVSFTQA